MICKRQFAASIGKGYCTPPKTDKPRFSNTVLLPKTELPLRLDSKKLICRDKFLSSNPNFTELYQWQRTRLKGNEFVLHDGPPYANGEPHMGHAINKVLKDVILRTTILRGNKVSYIPGWDCHGLPIEMKATSISEGLAPIAIREKARKFATETIAKQKEAFLSWGVMGDWQNSYATYSPHYVKNQITQFYNLYERKLVFRDVKPVYWSPSTRTALAEAELEYNANHKSTAVIVRMRLEQVPPNFKINQSIYALIWTTTPWTLPANQAICYNPQLNYSIVENTLCNEYYIVASNLVDTLSIKFGSELKIIQSFEGNVLKSVRYIHPIYKNQILSLLPASHATDTQGTGLVHTAPAHGSDDYLVALKHNISVQCVVDECGKFTSDAGQELSGLFVLSDGTKSVIDLIKSDILHIETYTHSYPYDWRTKKPVILRASKQWFIDTNAIKQTALDLLEKVKILPGAHERVYKDHFKTQLQKRPYWCISRQRSWGVPIPVFYTKDTEDVVINKDTIEIITKSVDDNNDLWWQYDVKSILNEDVLKKYNLDVNNLKKGQDILDIWFDSGMSWSSVLANEQIADLYLEGADQFTGWFQSSLLTSAALRGISPYKAIYVHGFAVDKDGKKMSKSLGNVINPKDILEGTKQQKPYGVDTLRWWITCHANQDSIVEVSPTVLKASSDEVQKIRSVLRFAVGALYDYQDVIIEYSELKLIDKYLLHLIHCYQKEGEEYSRNYEYNKTRASVIHFLTNNVSALYYTSIKDRLYCELQDSLSRRCAQYVLNIILQTVTRSIAPVVPHLAEELYSHFPVREADSFFKTRSPDIPKEWRSEEIAELVSFILDLRNEINKQTRAVLSDKDVILHLDASTYGKIQEYISPDRISTEMSDIFQVANVRVVLDDDVKTGDSKISIKNTEQHSCPRCRKFQSTTINNLCHRCNLVVNDKKMRISN